MKNSAKVITSEGLPDYLCRVFPESAEQVATIDREGPGALNSYTHMSEVFWWGIFRPSIANQDREQLVKCFRAVEDFLASEDDELREAAVILVTSYLADPALEELVATHAGWHLQKDLLRVRGPLPDL